MITQLIQAHQAIEQGKKSYSGTTVNLKRDRLADLTDFFEELLEIPEYWFNKIKDPAEYISMANKEDIHCTWVYGQISFEKAWKHAVESAFGDIKAETTRVDSSVRLCREITADKLSIDQQLLDTIKRKWMDATSQRVKVVPHKLLLYPKGGHFVEHVDTPSVGLLGTTLINLEGNSNCFSINNKPWIQSHNMCSFYSDVPHKINPVQNDRIVMSFKIFRDDLSSKTGLELSEYAKELVRRISPNANKIGFLLKHGYTYETNDCFKGTDQQLINLLEELKWNYRLVPVIVEHQDKHSLEISQDDNITGKVTISPLEESDAKFFGAHFYILGLGYLWSSGVRHNIFTGNEYNGSQLESTYINKAIIVELDK